MEMKNSAEEHLLSALRFPEFLVLSVLHMAVLVTVHWELFGISKIFEERAVFLLFGIEIAVSVLLYLVGFRSFRYSVTTCLFWLVIFIVACAYFAWHALTH